MDQRKLIKLGNSSFAIALPKGWIEKSGLKKGENVFITPNSNGELIVTSTAKKANGEKEIIINVKTKNKREINRELIAAYINGNNKIKIDGIKDMRFVKSVLKDLFGIEIIENKKDSLLVKDIIDLSSISVPSITRRIDNSVRSIIEELEPCIKKGSATTSEYNEILNADRDVNRLYFLLWRLMILGSDNPSVLNILNTDSSSLVYIWLIGMNLEKIGDELKRIARLLSKHKLKKDEIKKINIIFSQIKDNFINSLNAYHLKDKKLAFSVTKNKEQVYELCLKSNKNLITKDICDRLMNIQTSIHYIAKYTLYFLI